MSENTQTAMRCIQTQTQTQVAASAKPRTYRKHGVGKLELVVLDANGRAVIALAAAAVRIAHDQHHQIRCLGCSHCCTDCLHVVHVRRAAAAIERLDAIEERRNTRGAASAADRADVVAKEIAAHVAAGPKHGNAAARVERQRAALVLQEDKRLKKLRTW